MPAVDQTGDYDTKSNYRKGRTRGESIVLPIKTATHLVRFRNKFERICHVSLQIADMPLWELDLITLYLGVRNATEEMFDYVQTSSPFVVDRATYQGAQAVSVAKNISSRAPE